MNDLLRFEFGYKSYALLGLMCAHKGEACLDDVFQVHAVGNDGALRPRWPFVGLGDWQGPGLQNGKIFLIDPTTDTTLKTITFEKGRLVEFREALGNYGLESRLGITLMIDPEFLTVELSKPPNTKEGHA